MFKPDRIKIRLYESLYSIFCMYSDKNSSLGMDVSYIFNSENKDGMWIDCVHVDTVTVYMAVV